MPHTAIKLPQSTWGDLEAIFDSLAEDRQQKETVHHLLQVTREMSPYLTKLDLLREIICVALVLLPAEAQPPPSWRWLAQGPPGPPGDDS